MTFTLTATPYISRCFTDSDYIRFSTSYHRCRYLSADIAAALSSWRVISLPSRHLAAFLYNDAGFRYGMLARAIIFMTGATLYERCAESGSALLRAYSNGIKTRRLLGLFPLAISAPAPPTTTGRYSMSAAAQRFRAFRHFGRAAVLGAFRRRATRAIQLTCSIARPPAVDAGTISRPDAKHIYWRAAMPRRLDGRGRHFRCYMSYYTTTPMATCRHFYGRLAALTPWRHFLLIFQERDAIRRA